MKKKLWSGEFWSDGDFVSTVGPQGNESTIADYMREQGLETGVKKPYQQLYREQVHGMQKPRETEQLTLF